jgi:respiratory burst oxidase
METHVESQTAQDPFASALSLSSSPSSSSSSSSSSFSPSINVPLSLSQFLTEHQGTGPPHDGTQLLQNGEASMAESGIEGLRFIDIMGSGGMEWKDVEERFDGLAFTTNGPEPVVKWSDFSFCIGKNHKIV